MDTDGVFIGMVVDVDSVDDRDIDVDVRSVVGDDGGMVVMVVVESMVGVSGQDMGDDDDDSKQMTEISLKLGTRNTFVDRLCRQY